jgi:hypothetical protein
MRVVVEGLAPFFLLSSLFVLFVDGDDRTIDGSGNGFGGAAGTMLRRIAPVDYPGDGSGTEIKQSPTMPNPRTISNVVANQPNSVLNNRGLSDWAWAWGQFLDHDIDLTSSGAEHGTAHIPIMESADPLGPNPINFARSNYANFTGYPDNPRQQVNEITAFIDASNVYGSDVVRANALRTFDGGKLKTSDGNLLPFNTEGLSNEGGTSASFFLAGDKRANEQVGLTALHTLFVREHNRLADRIKRHYLDADDEFIYQLARKIVGAEMQIITYKEYLPALMGPMAPTLDDCNDYDDTINAGITNEFSAAAYRFGHSMLSPNLVLADQQAPIDKIPLRNAFFNPDFLKNNPANVDYLIHGFLFQQAQEVDNMIVDDVRNFLFGPPGAGGLDLASLNIQRGRDHGFPSYNSVRMAYGLPAAEDFSNISSDPSVQEALATVYASPDVVDLWVGGLAEDHVEGASVGELVATILAQQFMQLCRGDKYFYLNDPDLGPDELSPIIDLRSFSLSDVIRDNTNIPAVPKDLFFIQPTSQPTEAPAPAPAPEQCVGFYGRCEAHGDCCLLYCRRQRCRFNMFGLLPLLTVFSDDEDRTS